MNTEIDGTPPETNAVAVQAARARRLTWAWALLAAVCTGVLMAASLPPLDWSGLAWVAMVPLLVVLPRVGPGAAWLCGALAGLVYYRIGVDWLFEIYGGLAALGVIALSLWMGLAFRVARLLMERRPTALLWAMPLALVGQEVLRCEGLAQYRFPYAAFGYTQADDLWLAQIASLGGVHFVTFLLAAFNAAAAYAVRQQRLRSFLPVGLVGATVLVLAAIAQPRDNARRDPIRVTCVQAETDDYRAYLDLAEQAASDSKTPVFIVLPEHTVIEFIDTRSPFLDRLVELARRHSVYLCVGAHRRASPQAECYYDNVAVLIDPAGRLVGTQCKSVPVPFLSDGNPAREQAVFDTPRGRVGLLVCYDSDFSDVPRRIVARGAELLLVPVMNPEKWPGQQRWQQARMAALRSIELRRCAVRAASSGISQIVDSTGRTLALRTQEQGPGLLAGEVYASTERTPFVRGGYLFATLAGWAFLLLVVVLTLHRWLAAVRRAIRRNRPR